MSDQKYRISGWERFQHYKKPRPAWIKLHRTLLDDQDFQALSVRSRALLVMLWLIAAESEEGTIPSSSDVAWRLRLPPREVAFDISQLSHYLEPLYTDSSDDLASDRDRDREETEREGEGECSRKKSRAQTPKEKHLDYVLLSKDEHEKLKAVMNGQVNEMIERLNNYIGSKGVKYKSHYHTIMAWYRKDQEGKILPPIEPPKPLCIRCKSDPAVEGGLCKVCAKSAARNIKEQPATDEVDVMGLVRNLAEDLKA